MAHGGFQGTFEIKNLYISEGLGFAESYDLDMQTFYSDLAPSHGIWKVGDLVWHYAPTPGGIPGWVCVAAGIAAGTAWRAGTVYEVGSQISAGDRVYRCTVAGISGTNAPIHTSGQAVDGTVTWQYLGALVIFKALAPLSA